MNKLQNITATTPAEVLIKLSKDEHWYVRHAVAENPNTPIEVLINIKNK